jgi:nitrate reductase delta subunit
MADRPMLAPRRRDGTARRRVEDWTRTRFELGENCTVMAAELACGVPGCPPVETVVAFWTADGTRYRFKVFRPLAEVVEDDVPWRWLLPALRDEDGLGLACC